MGNYFLLSVVSLIVIFAVIKKAPVFDLFLEGAKEGITTTFSIIPALVGLVVCVSMLRSSGTIDILVSALSPFAKKVSVPPDVLPLALLRPISGSGALAVIQDIFEHWGPDTFTGRVASVMMGSTETTFYTIAVYYGSIGIKKTGITLLAALSADLTGMILSALTVSIFF